MTLRVLEQPPRGTSTSFRSRRTLGHVQHARCVVECLLECPRSNSMSRQAVVLHQNSSGPVTLFSNLCI
ncbi:hypothetical protein V1478_006328 [Vespula squamosa]|uniref:Uncharacterized protein n=1 Tax=Vespula squamosa TaxID=30214 RepID=A0ABD2B7I9_VESSQ